jgi:hypothetical protein
MSLVLYINFLKIMSIYYHINKEKSIVICVSAHYPSKGQSICHSRENGNPD